MTLPQFHASLGNSVLIFSLAIGLYGLLLYLRQQTVTSSYWGMLVVGELLYLAQMVVGVLLLFQRERLPGWRSVHILYGILPVITLPAAFAFTRGREDRQVAFMYGLIGFFLVGIALRAMTTAG